MTPAAAALLALALPLQAPIEVDVNLVNIFATVQDLDGGFVDDLGVEDFQVLEDGREVSIELFERHDALTTALGVLVDNSGSSSEVLRSVRAALPEFVRRLGAADRAFVMSFAAGARVIHDFGDADANLAPALDALRPFGTSVLFDALVSGIDTVGEGALDRQTLIVMTDGVDNRSQRSWADVVRRAEMDRVLLYFIAIGPGILVDRYTLEGLASMTGGRVVFLGRERTVADALDEIRDDLARQYYLAYHASVDAGYHTIEVRVPGRPVRVRARDGYRVE